MKTRRSFLTMLGMLFGIRPKPRPDFAEIFGSVVDRSMWKYIDSANNKS